jgi:hypothetical protein
LRRDVNRIVWQDKQEKLAELVSIT